MAKKVDFVNGELTGTLLVDKETGVKYEQALVPLGQVDRLRKDAGRNGLIKRIMIKIRPSLKDDTDTVKQKTTESTGGIGGSSNSAIDMYNDQMEFNENRKALYIEWKKMYRKCVYSRRALEVTVANVFSSRDGDQTSYVIKSEDTRTQVVLDEMDRRVGMPDFASKWCKDALKMGDSFTERVIDSNLLVRRLKRLPPNLMYRNEDSYGRLDAECAFTMRNDTATIANFPYFQVGHMRNELELGDRYGHSFQYPGRYPFRQLEMQKAGIIIRRLDKSTKRYAYYIPMPAGTPEAEQSRIIAEKKQELRRTTYADSDGNLDTRRKPTLEEQDIFIPVWENSPAKVEMFDPGGVSDNYEDVKLIRDELIMAFGVPPSYLGLDKEVRGRAHLGWIDIEFARRLREYQRMMATGQREVYDLQLVLLGMPAGDTYKVIYPAISFVDEQIKIEVDALKWKIAVSARTEMGMPTGWVLRNIVGLPEEDVEAILSDEDYVSVEPGHEQPEMPGKKQTQFAKEAFFNNQRVLDEIEDLRARFQYISKHGLSGSLEM